MDRKEMWYSLNKVTGSNKNQGSPVQIQDGKRLVTNLKKIATKFNTFFVSIGSKAVGKLPSVSNNASMKHECGTQNESQDLWGLQTTEYSTVMEILNTQVLRY